MCHYCVKRRSASFRLIGFLAHPLRQNGRLWLIEPTRTESFKTGVEPLLAAFQTSHKGLGSDYIMTISAGLLNCFVIDVS